MAQKKRPVRVQQDTSRRDSRRSPKEVSYRESQTEYRRLKKKKRRKKRRTRYLKALGVILVAIAILVMLGYLVVGVFQLKQIEVTGNQYCSQQEILDWVKAGKYSDNSLYVLWKYNQEKPEQLPAIESTKVKLKSPSKVQVQVTEKTYSGRIAYNDGFLYFDEAGMACLQTADVIEGVPYIEGMEIDQEQMQIGKALPVTDSQVFEEIDQISGILKEYELTADKITCEQTSLTLHFGGVRVMLGSSGFEEKMAQVPPILAKMSELYADQTGALHLENYSTSDSSIRFVPDTAPQ